MIRYDSTAHISRPPNEIFARLIDVETMDEWTDMTDGRWLTGNRALGARASAILHLGPIRRPLEWEVTGYEPASRVAFRTPAGSPIEWSADYLLDGDDTGTNVRTRGEVRLNGWLRLAEPLIRMELPKGESRELVRLKAILEHPSTVAASA